MRQHVHLITIIICVVIASACCRSASTPIKQPELTVSCDHPSVAKVQNCIAQIPADDDPSIYISSCCQSFDQQGPTDADRAFLRGCIKECGPQ